ncbi:hypothetical protein HPB49_006967 [Dermacentor silvarum]|uniref:Uncharacterized protein n=1 Tax=Dermacentor silvarum TaxID=543639 RepID=A0ACB8C2H3_DERSI|nr:hypothetical protein HPB49_006967 [Dermacentor silvarum]
MSRTIPSNVGRPSVTCCQSRGRESGEIQDESGTPMSAAQETSFGQEAFRFCRQAKAVHARLEPCVFSLASTVFRAIGENARPSIFLKSLLATRYDNYVAMNCVNEVFHNIFLVQVEVANSA